MGFCSVLVFSSSVGAQQKQQLSKDEVKSLIATAGARLPDDLSPAQAKFGLRLFVLELHVARSEIGLWDYEKDPKYREAFFQGYRAFIRGLAIKKLSTELSDEDLNGMLRSYEKHRANFYKFLEIGRSEIEEFGVFSLPNEEIIKRQTQFSLVVHNTDYDLWKNLVSVWSIFIPISEGP